MPVVPTPAALRRLRLERLRGGGCSSEDGRTDRAMDGRQRVRRDAPHASALTCPRKRTGADHFGWAFANEVVAVWKEKGGETGRARSTDAVGCPRSSVKRHGAGDGSKHRGSLE